jgi:TonB-linked SusC/RagA family outer membrane protein
MGLFSREQWAQGSEFAHYREDWVFRTTYNYFEKYLFEVNGAYNGSEKFGPDYRFEFFPSFSAGWMLSEENFIKNNLGFIDFLKIRGSWGIIGDDNIGARFLYADEWDYGNNAYLGDPPSETPYTFYRVSKLGNPDISWETVEKKNLGVEYNFFKGLISGSVDLFKDRRTDILLSGNRRAVPTYFGMTPPVANIGIVNSQGWELELKLSKAFANGFRLWLQSNMTHATNEIEFADDPVLEPSYQQNAGYAIGQVRSFIDHGFIESWDDLYGSTERSSNNGTKLAGDYNIIDFNGDGVINTYDRAPYQYSGVPQNTYSSTFGIDWRGFSMSLQFYGVNNVTRQVVFPTFHSQSNVAYVEGEYYTAGEGGEIPIPRKLTTVGDEAAGTRYYYDGSFVRLKNAEVSYKMDSGWVNRIGISNCRLYVNGSNLWLWTDMPDDRESNFSTGGSSGGAYPTVKRINVGLELTF